MNSGCPRLLIAAPQGRSGKTTLSLGLCASLAHGGMQVQPFKKGPDYIDPSWLSAAAGRPCRTLDPFFHPTQADLARAFRRGIVGADLAIIEGNHGLFDSVEEDGSGSSAAVARALKTPILLVVNAARMGRSAAAMVHGYQTFEPGTNLAGVVLNQVAGKRHEDKLRSAIETHCCIPVVGAIPRDRAISIPDRHLGLVPRAEDQALIPVIEACRLSVERYVDVDAVLEMARGSGPLPAAPPLPPVTNPKQGAFQPVIVVIRDRAFTFYYPENLEALESAGARLVFIDALQCPTLPQVDALYIGGGFPEMFLEELAANVGLRNAIRMAVEGGLPVYAECGGLMYLAQRIHWEGRSAEMVGVLPFEVEDSPRPQGHGYVQAQVVAPNPFWQVGTVLRGHEFHHSYLTDPDGLATPAYRLVRGSGLGNGRDGLVYHNVLASYTHLHADGSPGWAEGLVNCARQYAQERGHG